MLVRATDMSVKLHVKIKELHRIATPGEQFEVSPMRYDTLSGKNRFNAVFVEKVEEVYTRDDVEPFETLNSTENSDEVNNVVEIDTINEEVTTVDEVEEAEEDEVQPKEDDIEEDKPKKRGRKPKVNKDA